MDKKIILLVIFGLILSITPLANSEDINGQKPDDLSQNALTQIRDAQIKLNEIQELGIKTNRLSDLLLIATATLEIEIDLAKKSNRLVNLSAFSEKMSEFRKISNLAIKSNDELIALKQELDLASKEVADISPAMELYNNAKTEIENERFERAIEYIDKSYEKIFELQSLTTRAEAIYEAAAGSIIGFFTKYYIEISTAIVTILILYLVLNIKLKKSRIKEKIISLETERDILKKEIKTAQEEYFIKGIISEGTYTTRVSVFGEMIRDITKELAVLKEEEAKISSKNRLTKNKTKVKEIKK